MTNSNEDDFVEKLLRDLPKAPPMSALEIKRFERHVDSLFTEGTKSNSSRGWTSKLTVAASVVALVAGLAIYTNNSEIIKGGSKTTLSQGDQDPTAAPSKSPDAGNEEISPEVKPSIEPDSEIAEYGNTKSPEAGTKGKSVPVLNTGIDYESDLQLARTKVLPLAKKGDLVKLSSKQLACSVKLDIDKVLYAIDEAEYGGEVIEAYYFGDSKDNLKIKIVRFGCELVTEL